MILNKKSWFGIDQFLVRVVLDFLIHSDQMLYGKSLLNREEILFQGCYVFGICIAYRTGVVLGVEDVMFSLCSNGIMDTHFSSFTVFY